MVHTGFYIRMDAYFLLRQQISCQTHKTKGIRGDNGRERQREKGRGQEEAVALSSIKNTFYVFRLKQTEKLFFLMVHYLQNDDFLIHLSGL